MLVNDAKIQLKSTLELPFLKDSDQYV